VCERTLRGFRESEACDFLICVCSPQPEGFAMTITLEELTKSLDPQRSAIVMGAGASVPSGAPNGTQLAHHLWREVNKSEPLSDDLIETASLLSRKYNRRDVIDAVVGKLSGLSPTGGIAGLPMLGWKSLFSTNFDQLIEKSFKAKGIPLATYRSNFDFSTRESNTGVKYYKIHGCITQDRSLGDKPSMIITDDDYDNFSDYRDVLFNALNGAMLVGDVLIVGQSLKDKHLSDLAKKILKAKSNGAPGRLYMLVYDRDDIRATLLEDLGIRVAFGGIDEFVHSYGNSLTAIKDEPGTVESPLPLSVVSSVVDQSIVKGFQPQIDRMFNGSPASYADIESGATFERVGASGYVERLVRSETPVLAITGAAGVGKTTLARQIASRLAGSFDFVWEHKSDFAFNHKPWISIAQRLKSDGRRAVLLIDECTPYLRSLNQLIETLNESESFSLVVIATANSAQWTPRMKSSVFFSRKAVVELSSLDDQELRSLINLVEHNPKIAELVTKDFKRRDRYDQFETLKRKCSADMFVCLKNVFATETLDDILLQEYDQLGENLQEYYRYVSAMQAFGARVHRQMIIRMLNVSPQSVSAVLDGLNGIVDEYVINERNGIYGWSVRHLVIARRIAEYKFSSLDEIVSLFDNIIDNINPSVSVELQTLRNICDNDYGIGRIGDANTRNRLYKRLIQVVPGERIPWHRLIKEALSAEDFTEAEYLIRAAENAVGRDGPIDRFKVRLMMLRAQMTPRISPSDRLAILRKAYEVAISNLRYHSNDKYSYALICDVAFKMVERGESEYLLTESIQLYKDASDRIQDPDMARQLRSFEQQRYRLKLH